MIRAGGGMESVCQSGDIGFTSPLPPIGGQVRHDDDDDGDDDDDDDDEDDDDGDDGDI